ncbi:MAG: hypothetical protein GXY77_16570 [Fibrobacter sp.]|nr:hypothetical protein [Fibrobacter sp.]
MILCKGFLILSVFVLAVFGGPNSSAVISMDMNQDLDGNQKYFVSHQEKDTFTVFVRVSEFNDQKDLNYFTVRMKIDSSKYIFVSSSFETEKEENILGTNPQSPGFILTDSTIEIGAALLTPPYPEQTEGLLGVFKFVSKTGYYDSISIILDEVSLCVPGPQCDYFTKSDSGIFVAKPVVNLSVTQSGSGVTYPDKDTVVTCGDTVNLMAVSDDNWKFVKWNVTEGSADVIDKAAKQTRIIIYDEDVVVEAEFDNISSTGRGIKKSGSGYDLLFKNGRISFSVPSSQTVSVMIYDAHGKTVCRLLEKNVSCGYHSVEMLKGMVPKGFYLCCMQAKNWKKTIKLNIID